MKFYVLVRENLRDAHGNPIPKGTSGREVVISAHWDRAFLVPRDANGAPLPLTGDNDTQAKWHIAEAETKTNPWK